MTLMRTALLAAFGFSLSITAASATDFYVQPVKVGPVVGVPLAVVNLSAGVEDEEAPEAAPAGAPAAKWLRVGGNLPGVLPPQPFTVGTLSAGIKVTARDLALDPVIVDVQAAPVAPWKSVGQVLASGQVKGGDRIFLQDGYHGPLVVRNLSFTSPVLISPAPGATAHVESILAAATNNVIFKGLKVWPTSQTSTASIVRTYNDTSDLAFVNLDIRGAADAGGYMSWPITRWNGLRDGMLIQGKQHTITGTRLTAVQNGIITTGDNTLLDNNIIDGFSRDASRALGDYSVVRGNKIQNCIDDGSASHRDGFQTYSVGSGGKVGTGTQYGLVVENNKIFEWTSPVANPLRCRLQGISMFDGMYDGFRIENNVVVVSAYHGIAMAGALNSVIRQNTVVNPNGQGGKWPWIRISYHKNGTPPRNSEIVNNLVMNVSSLPNATLNIVVANNARVGAATSEFVDFANENLALAATSKGVDAGDPKKMTATDIMSTQRFKGKAPDAGAYESR